MALAVVEDPGQLRDVDSVRSILFRRTLLMIAALSVVTFGVIVATDEVTSTLAMRIARLGALTPLVSAVSISGIFAHAASRGEIAALSTLGVPPWRAVKGATVAGLVAGGVAALVLMSKLADPSSLFPAMHPSVAWQVDDSRLLARALGVMLRADGSLQRHVRDRIARLPTLTSWAALPSVLPMAMLAPPWAATPMAKTARVGSVLATTALAIVLFHCIAAAVSRLRAAWRQRAPWLSLSSRHAAFDDAFFSLLLRRSSRASRYGYAQLRGRCAYACASSGAFP